MSIEELRKIINRLSRKNDSASLLSKAVQEAKKRGIKDEEILEICKKDPAEEIRKIEFDKPEYPEYKNFPKKEYYKERFKKKHDREKD